MSANTLTDEQFLAEVDALIGGRENSLVEQKPAETPPVTETPPVAETPPVEAPPVEETPATEEETVSTPDPAPANSQDGEEVKPADEGASAPQSSEVKTDEPAGTENTQDGEVQTPPSEPDYKAVYQRLFGTPIRAAGQDITLTNPEEAISLIQKGVGFHHKMNRLHNDLKYVEMLRNNNLLDEERLSLLIDAQAGNVGAIKKLLDSAKVDPLSLDSTEASTYAPSDHRVTDEQVQFQSTVSDLSDSEAGKKILIDARSWDQNTKAEIFKNPAILQSLAQQKEMGRYDLIVAEVNRAKLLGTLPATEPFISAYTRVGQQMMQAGAFGTVNSPPPSTPTPVAQKTVTPPPLANSKKATAAAPTRTSSSSVKPVVDISKMDDAAFEAHFRKTFNI